MQHLLSFPIIFIILCNSSNFLYIILRCWHQKATLIQDCIWNKRKGYRHKTTSSPWFITSPFVCPKSQPSFPAQTWHRKLPKPAFPFWHPDLRHSPPSADHVQDTPFQVHNSSLVCTKMILFQWVHLPNKPYFSVLPLSIATIHKTCFIYTFCQLWVTLSSASLSKCQAELAFLFPSFEGKGHWVYFFENTVSTYHVAETLL